MPYQSTQINTPPTQCPLCGGNIILKTGRKQDGSTYRFYGCSNFRDLGCRFTWRPIATPTPTIPKPFLGNMLTQDIFIKYLGVLRGDIKKLEDKINKLFNVSVIYPAKIDKTGETNVKIEVPIGEPPEDIPEEEESLEDL